MPHRILQIGDVAAYLHLTVQDVERLVRRGEIPHERHGDRVVFRRGAIQAWASQRVIGFDDDDAGEFHTKSTAQALKVSQESALMPCLITSARIAAALPSRTRASVLADMVDLADATELVSSREDLLESLRAREELCSTAVAGGIALLHPRHHEAYAFTESFIVMGRTVQPIPFGAPDGKTTDLFFLICCQDDRLHLHTLSRLCVMLYRTEIAVELRSAETADEMYVRLVMAEDAVLRHG